MTETPAAPGAIQIGPRLILVVGARRSGTNWIGRIIASHPDVVAVPSETFLFQRIAELRNGFHHGAAGSWQLAALHVRRETFLTAVRAFCDTVLAETLDGSGPTTPTTRLLERTPDHANHLGLISELYPDAHVVHMIRDGRDVARSLATMSWGPGSLMGGASEWATSVRAARAASSQLRHYHEVRYEALFADPAAMVTRLFADLDLPHDGHTVDAALVEAGVAYNHDPSMPVMGTERWRGSLSRSQVGRIERMIGPLLREMGYPTSSSTSRAVALVDPTREAAARWRRRLHRRSRRPNTVDALELQAVQVVVDDFINEVIAGREDDAVALIDERAHACLVTGSERTEGRGPEAVNRVVAAMTGDAAFAAVQAASDVHPSESTYTIVSGEGSALRTLVLNVESGTIRRISYYRP